MSGGRMLLSLKVSWSVSRVEGASGLELELE